MSVEVVLVIVARVVIVFVIAQTGADDVGSQ